jgi:restriction system protein
MPYYHSIKVKWIETDIPRSNFDQDILYSLGAFMTVCQIKRNDAEKRIREMAKNNWKSTGFEIAEEEAADTEQKQFDIETAARDQIAKLVIAKFKGHAMARLVEGILKAQGYSTYLSPEGPDKGVDILAGQGPLGFDPPRLCVQVKSGDTPVDRPTLDQLLGSMKNFQADQGLLVSWGGFKITVDKEEARQFFSVRLWDRDDLIQQIFNHYSNLSDEIRAELPLKRIWIVTFADTGNE